MCPSVQCAGLDHNIVNPPSHIDHVVDNYYRPDLKKAALARLSVIGKGLRVAKSGPKRRNRQA
ncbi:hypothetical protein F2Q70_00013676 [Brassica cretica]|uniref:Uncharacterized protein n=1 Tax=Brassica cretica TaxID=69181 RepID=A0A8S9LUX9_BRACR|nr:hypothetical protein F2Q70_00013676 [Brassica cretica]